MVDNGLSRSWWNENLLRPVLIAAMMVCLATPPIIAVEWIVPGWDGTYVLVFCFLAGLEGILSERVLRQRRITGGQYIASRAAEMVILLLLLKIVNALPGGLSQLWENAGDWIADPVSFITPVDGVTWGLLGPLWIGALVVSRRASGLDVGDDLEGPPEDKTSAAYYLWVSRPSPLRDRGAALQWLGDTVVWGGIAMLGTSTALYIALPDSRLPLVAILIYFALGVTLLSQARFSVSQAGWKLQGIPVQPSIAGRWLVWAVLFLVGVAAVALLLPTQYMMGPVLAIYNLILIVGQFLAFLVRLLFYALSWLVSLFSPNMDAPEVPALSLTPLPVEETGAAGATPSWSGFVLTLVFWAVILALVAFAVIRVLKDRLGHLEDREGRARTWWGRVLAWLADQWRRWRAWRREVQSTLADRLSRRRRERARAAGLRRLASLRRLSPRDMVRYFYLSTVRRAAQAGQPRRPGQTPYEYQSTLDQRFSDLEPDLSGLTDAFVQARYGPGPVEKQDAEAVRPLWQRIKTALRRRRVRTATKAE